MTTIYANRFLKYAIMTALVLTASTLSATASDWPCFLGPNHNDTSPETGLARSWPEAGPRVLWTLPLGEGYGGAAVRKIWEVPNCGSQLHVPILHQSHFYLNGNTNRKRDGLLCLSPSGEILWQTTNSRKLPTAREGLPKFDRGNHIMADGMFFILEGAKGTLHLTEPSPEGYKELAQAKLLDGKQI